MCEDLKIPLLQTAVCKRSALCKLYSKNSEMGQRLMAHNNRLSLVWDLYLTDSFVPRKCFRPYLEWREGGSGGDGEGDDAVDITRRVK